MSTPPPIPPTPITSDLLCISCQYNLRTRTPQDRCPECGLPVAQSLTHRQQHAQAIKDPRTLRTACYFFAIPSLASPLFVAALLVLSYFQPRAPRPLVIAEVLLRDLGQCTFIFSLLMGVILFLNSVGTQIVSLSRRSGATIVTIVYCLLSFAGIMGSLSLLRRFNPARGGMMFLGLTMMREQRLGATFMCLLLALEGYAALRQLAKSLAEPRLAALSRWVFAAVIADCAISMLLYFLLGAWRPFRAVSTFQAVFTAIDIASAIIFALFGWHWLRVARTVGQVTTVTPQPHDPAPAPSPVTSSEQKINTFLSNRRNLQN